MNRLLITLLLAATAFIAGCANPADKAEKAVVSNEAPAASPVDESKSEKLAISPGASKVEFTGSKVTGSEHGSFQKFEGTISLVDGKPEKSRVAVDIDTASVTTDADGLADHLKTADFFEVTKYPKASFVSSTITPNADKPGTYTVSGTLELHGVKKNISFPATITVKPDSVSVESEFAINRKDFGIMYAGRTNDLIRDEVVLKLALQAPREAG